ncbi:MAG: hypothetical protein ACYCXT_03965 [Acidiferrobacteraceae bacterium]
MNFPFNFDRAIEGLTKIKLPGGVVGRVTLTLMVVSLAFVAIAWSGRNIWLSAAALGLSFILAFVMLWRLINFADRNPQAALFEGSEFLLHEQIVHASKLIPIPLSEATVQVQPEAIEGPDAIVELAELPDDESLSIDNDGGKQ